jgi:hypothetical protein
MIDFENGWFSIGFYLDIKSAKELIDFIRKCRGEKVDSIEEVKIVQRHSGIVVFPFVESKKELTYRMPKIEVDWNNFKDTKTGHDIRKCMMYLYNFDILCAGGWIKNIKNIEKQQLQTLADALEVALVFTKGLEMYEKIYTNKLF